MIIVHIDFDPEERAFVGQRASDMTDALREMRDATESIVGLVFSEQQERVDVRIRPFGAFDQFEEPLFVTIDVDDREMHHAPEDLCKQFMAHFSAHFDAYFSHRIPIRVWVRRITGSFAETAR